MKKMIKIAKYDSDLRHDIIRDGGYDDIDALERRLDRDSILDRQAYREELERIAQARGISLHTHIGPFTL